MNVTVVGAGLMGAGIAQVFLAAGHDVVLQDKNIEALRGAEKRIREIYTWLAIAPDLSRLELSDDLNRSAASSELVVEAVIEDLQIKQEVFRHVSEVVRSDTILATNTSSIPVGQIAAVLPNPEQLVGTHFWNPPWAVDLVEVIQGERTSPDVVKQTMQLLSDLCMQPVHVKRDIPGCIGNRLQHAMKREAIALVESGVCDAEDLDTVVKSGFGMRLAALGPLEQSDLVGLDLTLRIHEALIPDLDVTPKPSQLLQKRVRDGDLGMRTGKGFREWTSASAALVRQTLDESLAANGRARVARMRERGTLASGNSDE